MNIQHHYLLHHNIQIPIRTYGNIKHIPKSRHNFVNLEVIQQPHNLHPGIKFTTNKSINKPKYTFNKPFQPNYEFWALWNINQHVPFLTSLHSTITTLRETLTASPTLPYRKI